MDTPLFVLIAEIARHIQGSCREAESGCRHGDTRARGLHLRLRDGQDRASRD